MYYNCSAKMNKPKQHTNATLYHTNQQWLQALVAAETERKRERVTLTHYLLFSTFAANATTLGARHIALPARLTTLSATNVTMGARRATLPARHTTLGASSATLGLCYTTSSARLVAVAALIITSNASHIT